MDGTTLDRILIFQLEQQLKLKVLIEAGSQGNKYFNYLTTKSILKIVYLIGGIGIATAPAAEVITNVRSENRTGEYGYTKDTIYEKGQKVISTLQLKTLVG